MFELLVTRSQSIVATPEVFVVLPEQSFARAALSRLHVHRRTPSPEGTLTYLCGLEGFGKSFLARHAIREIRRQTPKLRYLIASAVELSRCLMEAESSQNLAELLDCFESLDVLVCEDLHDLEAKPEAQDLLLELIDNLHATGSHVLVTCRKLPGELKEFSSRWISRCHGGFSAVLPTLSEQSRIQLIREIVHSRHLPFAQPVESSFAWLANRFTSSTAELVRQLHQLEMTCQQQDTVIDVAYLQRWSDHETTPELLSLEAIASLVAGEFGISVDELRSRSRQPSLIVPRQCAMFLARDLTRQSLESIGVFFGERTHTTVSHCLSRLNTLLPKRPSLRQQVQRLRKRLLEALRQDCA